MNPNCLYIEITRDAFKLLNEGERFEAALERQPNGRLTPGCKETLQSRLQEFLRQKLNRTAWCAIPAQGVSLRKLSLPSVAKDDFQRVLRFQIESEFPLSPDQLAWGTQPLGKDASGRQQLLAGAVKKELIQDFHDVLSACGVTPTFTVAPIARTAACPQPPSNYSVMDLSGTQSELITLENGVPVSIRVLPCGGNNFQPAGLNRSSLGSKLFITGNHPCSKQVADQLLQYFNHSVEVELVPASSEAFTAAIHGLQQLTNNPSTTPLILRFTESDDLPRTLNRPAQWKLAALGIFLLLAWGSLPYLEAFLLKPRYEVRLKATDSEKDRFGIIDRELAFLQDLKKLQSPYLDTLYLLADSAPKGTRFDAVSMNRRGEISFRGSMPNGQQVSEFRSKLIASGFFSTVVVDEQSPSPDRQKVIVKITAQWKPAGARKSIVIDSPKTNAPATNPVVAAAAGSPAPAPSTR